MTRIDILAAIHADDVAALTWQAWLEGVPMSWWRA